MASRTAPIRTCVLGVGLAGLTFHVPFILALPKLFTLHSVLERNPQSEGGKVEETFGVKTKIVRTLEDVLNDHDVELVIVGTPNNTHYDIAKRVILAGKHVLVDKPVTATHEQALELQRLAKEKGVILYPFQNRRWDSDFLALRRLLAISDPADPHYLGEIIEFESHYDRFRLDLKGSWKDLAQPANGQTYDLGTHLIDQVLHIFGRPSSLTAFLQNSRGIGDPSVDDSFTILMHYSPQAPSTRRFTAILRASILSVRSPQLRFIVRGTKGSFVKYGLDVQEDQLKLRKPGMIHDAEVFGREPEDISGTVETIAEDGKIMRAQWPSEAGSYQLLFRNLAASVRGLEQPAVRMEQSASVIQMVELAHQSSREGRTLTVPPI